MAQYEDGCYGSLTGVSLIAKVLAGRCTMHYTRVAVGKGHIPEGESPKTMPAPADYVMDARISGITNPVNGECQVTVQINSADVENGFYCTGLMLYAEDPDEGEVPFTYLVLETEPEWIRPSSSIVGKLATFDIIAAVGDVDAVTAYLDPDAFATISEMERMIEDKIKEYPSGGYTAIYRMELPANGWQDADASAAGYKVFCDIEEPTVTSGMFPSGASLPEYANVADAAGVVCGCETFDGFIRFYAKRKPSASIIASVAVFEKKRGSSGGGGGGDISPATRHSLGGVIIGNGISVAADGTISVDQHTVVTENDLLDEDATEQDLKQILLTGQGQPDESLAREPDFEESSGED